MPSPRVAPSEPCTLGEAAGTLARLFVEDSAQIIRGVLEPSACEEMVARLEEIGPPRHRFSPAFAAESVGRILDQARDDDDYFGARPGYLALLAEIAPFGLEERLQAALAHLAGAPVRVPIHPALGGYGLTTLRRLPQGGTIPPHCDTEQLSGPRFAHLRTFVDTSQVVSWLVVLQLPEAGGELARYDVAPDGDLGRKVYAERDRAVELLEGAAVERLRPGVGEMLVFSAGRRFHRVVPVEGRRSRWTIGGFVVRGLDGGFYAFS